MMRHTALRTALALVIAACAGCSAGAPEPPAEALFNDPGLASHSALPQGADPCPPPRWKAQTSKPDCSNRV